MSAESAPNTTALPIAETAVEGLNPAPVCGTRWPPFWAILTCFFLPATTARRTNGATLWQAWLVHVTAAVLCLPTLIVLVTLDQAPRALGVPTFGRELVRQVHELHIDLFGDLMEATLVVGGLILGVEIGTVMLAAILCAWGATVEPVADTLRHALRRTLLQTAAVPAAIMMVGLFAVLMDRNQRFWMEDHSDFYSTWPTYPAGIAPSSPPFQQAMDEYQQAVRAHQALQPWLVRYEEPACITFGFVIAASLLWAFFRAVGAARPAPAGTRPPLCEACGYNLTTLPPEARCPECGLWVVDSLGPQVRPGVPCQATGVWRRIQGLVITPLMAVAQPTRLGHRVRLYDCGRQHRTFAAVHVPLLVLLNAGGLLLILITAGVWQPLYAEQRDFVFVFAIAGTVAACAALSWTSATASAVGLILSLLHQRGLLSAAAQGACYLLPYLTLGTAASWTLGAVIIKNTPAFLSAGARIKMPPGSVQFFVWLIPSLAALLIHLVLIWKITRAARYANK